MKNHANYVCILFFKTNYIRCSTFDYGGCSLLLSKMYVHFTICNLYFNICDLKVLSEINAIIGLTFA